MKIIHTADWHIGKLLYKQGLNTEIELFFNWLETYILTEKPNLLLVSGDVFDLANPSNKDQELYFSFLSRLSKTGIETIITGGNHDSISLLNAPKSIYGDMKIHVLGGLDPEINNHIIPIYKDAQLSCIVLAVPFLRERDLKVAESADKVNMDIDAVSLAVKSYYDRWVVMAQELYGKDIPIIAMGHLFMRGSMISDGEREIHVGNLQGIESKYIHPDINYLALGHIHKPQRIGGSEMMRYSGSPIYLDFSEAKYSKQVVIIDIEDGMTSATPMMIPKFRNLLSLHGSMMEIKKQLSSYKNDCPLQTFIEIDVVEPAFSLEVQHHMTELTNDEHPDYKVIKWRIGTGMTDLQTQSNLIKTGYFEQINPVKMLEMRLENEDLDDETKLSIFKQYKEIEESLYN